MNESRGEANYSIPLLTPPGAAGTGPELVLQYTSGVSGAAGWLGLGWQLSGIDSIERDTLHGVPFDYESGVGCGAAPCYLDAFLLDGRALFCANHPCDGRFHAEQHIGRSAVYHGEQAGWTVHEPSGRRSEYGSDPATRIVNPRNGQVFAWLLARREDPHGNWIEFEYEITGGIAYPSRILWAQAGSSANRSVVFTSQPRTDAVPEFRSGFRRTTDRSLVRIDVRADADALVTAYELNYQTSPDSGRSLLVSVARIGADGESRLPPHVFTYTEGPRGFLTSPTNFCQGLCPPNDLAAQEFFPNVVLLDANGDALPDVYEAFDQLTRVALHDGTALDDGWRSWLDDGARYRDGHDFDPVLINGMILDLDGDGLPDWLYQNGAEYEARFGTGAGFAAPVPAPLPPGPGQVSRGLLAWPLWGLEPSSEPGTNPYLFDRHLNGGLLDLTGDGLPDHVRARHADWHWSSEAPLQSQWIVHPALGEAADGSWRWSSTPLDWPDPLGLPLEFTDVYVLSSYEITLMVDWNADGLPDRLHRERDGPGTEFLIAYANGFGFAPPEPVWWHAASDFWSRGQTNGCTTHDFVDLNGDGYPDQVVAPGSASPDQAGHPYFEGLPRDGWGVRLGGGGALPDLPLRWGGTAELDPFLGFLYTHETCVRGSGGFSAGRSGLADFDGDGLLDRYTDPYGVVFLADGEPPDLLSAATSPLGARVEFQYSGSAELLVETANGQTRPASRDLPRSRPVVTRMTLDDGAGGPTIEWTYHYADGILAPGERTLRGFGTVTRHEPDPDAVDGGAIVVSSYRTDRACAGRPSSREVQRADEAALLRDDWAYTAGSRPETATALERWTWCWAASHTHTASEAGAGEPQRSRSEWLYGRDPVASLGQPVEVRALGAVDSAGLDRGNDDNRFTYTGYARPIGGAEALQSLPAEVLVTAEPWGDPLSQVRIFYDDLPLGQVDAGLVSRVQRRLVDPDTGDPFGGEWIEQQNFYDAWGNLREERGPATAASPAGLRVERASDPTYQSFPSLHRIGAGTDTPLDTELFYDGCLGTSPPAALGLPCRTRDPRGAETRYGYDAFGRVVRVEHASGLVERHEYTIAAAASGGSTRRRILEPGGAELLVFEERFDGLDRLVLEQAPGAAGETIEMLRRYDRRGRLAAVSVPHFAGEPEAAEVRIVRDALGRPSERYEADAQTWTGFQYRPGAVVEEVWLGSARASRSQRSFDARGRLVEVAQASDPLSAVLDERLGADYDALDRLVRVSGAGSETRLGYDSLGRRVWLDDPDSGTWKFRFDAAGNLLERTDALARRQTFEYDALGRVVLRSFAPTGNGIENAVFQYGSDPAATSYGRLVGIDSAGAGTDYRYDYDLAGRLVAEEQTTSSLRFASAYDYDSLGRMVGRSFPDGETFAYQWSGARLAGLVGLDGPGQTIPPDVLLAASYDALGRSLELQIGGQAGEPATAHLLRSYDPASGRLAGLQALGSAGLVLDLSLGFDGLGRLTDLQGSSAGQSLGARSFEYDGLGRLVRALGPWEPELHGDQPVAWSYRYDALGNLLAQESSGGHERSFTYADPAHPHFLTGFQAHDAPPQAILPNAAGEPVSIDGQPLVWNAAARLHESGGATDRLHYDALGRRTRRTLEDGTSIIRVGDDFEYDTATGRARKWFAVNGERIAARDTAWSPASAAEWLPFVMLRSTWYSGRAGFAAGLLLLALASLAAQLGRAAAPDWLSAPGLGLLTALLVLPAVPAQAARGGKKAQGEPLMVYVADHLGSVRVILDAGGNVIGTRDYLPFGGDLQRAGARDVAHGFAGQPRDATSGLQEHDARLYQPNWGRFISPDESLESFDPVGLHPYAYVRNQPTSRIDPTGGSSVAFFSAAASVSTGAVTVVGHALSLVANRLGPDHPAAMLLKAVGTGVILTGTTVGAGLLLGAALGVGSGGLLIGAALVGAGLMALTIHRVVSDVQAFQASRSLHLEVETSASRLATPAVAFSPPRSTAGAKVVSARYDGASFVVRYADGSTRSVEVSGDSAAGSGDPQSDLWGEAPGTQGPATKQQASTEAIVEAARVGPGYGNISQQIARMEWIAAGGGNWVSF